MKYFLLTLGCQMNISDSERLTTVLEGMGYAPAQREEEADLLGVIACSVRQKAIDKVYMKIHKWNRMKEKKAVVTFLTGCVLPADREKFLKLFDLVFTTNEIPSLPEMLSQYGVVTPFTLQGGKKGAVPEPEKGAAFPSLVTIAREKGREEDRSILDRLWEIAPTFHSPFEAFVPIQNGCDKFCTYCAVPFTRGREVSRPSEEVLAETETLLERGYKSITLLGQNVNSYGLDKKSRELTFAGLLEEIGQRADATGRRVWIYFTSPHPRDMGRDVTDVIARHDSLAKQIHLPLQSGDDEILQRMNRKHTVDDYRAILRYIREKLPSATLFTDIITGFPGETEEQFENTRRVLQEMAFNMAYIAVYSPRPGTKSARWKDDVPMKVKKERLHRLTEVLEEGALAANRRMLDRTLPVLVTGKDRKDRYLSGHTEGRIPVRFSVPGGDTSLIGHFVTLRITSVTPFSMEGELIRVEEEVWQ
jgi:tRNA-2-methylthio-N6-dimethylallyladenosine synthase